MTYAQGALQHSGGFLEVQGAPHIGLCVHQKDLKGPHLSSGRPFSLHNQDVEATAGL